MNWTKILCLAMTLVMGIPPLAWAQRYVLANANVVDVTNGSIKPRQYLVIEGERIQAIVDNPQLITGRIERTFDLKGRYVMPGFWDMHVSDPVGAEWFDLMLAQGITGVRLFEVHPDSLADWKRRKAAGEALPRMYGAASALTEAQADSAWQVVDSLQQAGLDFIVAGRHLSRTQFLAVQRATERRQMPLVAALPLSVSLYEALRNGLSSSEGGYGMLMASSVREDYLRDVAWGVRNDPTLQSESDIRRFLMETYAKPKADSATIILGRRGLWLCPTLTAQEARGRMEDSLFRQDERLEYLSPRLLAQWEAQAKNPAYDWTRFAVERALFEILRNLSGRYEVTQVQVLAGSGTGHPYVFPGSSLHDELAHLVAGGMTIEEVLRTTTLYPVQHLGLTADYGTVEEGKIANLVILDRNPLLDIRHTREVEGVVLDGKYYQRLALQMKQARIMDRHQRKEIVPLLLTAYARGGVDAMRERYQSLEREDVFKQVYNFDEASLEQVGQTLLAEGHPAAAIEAFQLNAAAYPRSWRAYQSLGRAYEAANKPEQALRSYQKAAELNPESYELRSALQRLKP